LLNRLKHTRVTFAQGDLAVCRNVNSNTFMFAKQISDQLYEIQHRKRSVLMNVPKQIGLFTLWEAKIIMINFYYFFIKKYIPENCFELMYMDTDSFCLALSNHVKGDKYGVDTLRSLVPADMLDAFDDEAKNWMVTSSEERRTPSKFKLEYLGKDFVALCSKTYHTMNLDYFDENYAGIQSLSELKDLEYKFSSKGLQKKAMPEVFHRHEAYEKALQGKSQELAFINCGMKSDPSSSKMVMYQQERRGLTNINIKRKMCLDGIHSEPLQRIYYCGPPGKEEE